jgi:hypothetical protein
MAGDRGVTSQTLVRPGIHRSLGWWLGSGAPCGPSQSGPGDHGSIGLSARIVTTTTPMVPSRWPDGACWPTPTMHRSSALSRRTPAGLHRSGTGSCMPRSPTRCLRIIPRLPGTRAPLRPRPHHVYHSQPPPLTDPEPLPAPPPPDPTNPHPSGGHVRERSPVSSRDGDGCGDAAEPVLRAAA